MNPTQTLAFLCILLGIAVLCIVTILSHERVRREILNGAKVYRDHALADLALCYEAQARAVSYTNHQEAMRALEQIALDATRERREFSMLQAAAGSTVAFQSITKNGGAVVFTPSAAVYLKENLPLKRRLEKVYPVNGLVCGPLVIAELRAVAGLLGLHTLPRAEQWEAIVLRPEDFSIAPKSQGLRMWFKVG